MALFKNCHYYWALNKLFHHTICWAPSIGFSPTDINTPSVENCHWEHKILWLWTCSTCGWPLAILLLIAPEQQNKALHTSCNVLEIKLHRSVHQSCDNMWAKGTWHGASNIFLEYIINLFPHLMVNSINRFSLSCLPWYQQVE
jgi:hypothetical protein